MTEREILERLRLRVASRTRAYGAAAATGIVKGIGDDCAIYRGRGSAEDLVLTTDLLIEGVHFLQSTHSPEAIGHKTLARGLSDIASMGARPRFCLLSLALPETIDTIWIDRFYSGLLDLAELHGAVLAGGDLSRADRIACDIVCGGSVPVGKALLRSGAKPGDAIYVSGRLGGSALGLATQKGAAFERHLRPEPRIALGQKLRTQLHATAAMDLSDGLSIDLARMCEASGTAAALDRIPRFRGATLEQALHGGEDYELLFTVRPRTQVPEELCGIPLTRVGTILAEPAGQVRFKGALLPALGHDHFRK